MFPSIVASPVVSSLNQPWLQGRWRRDVLMRSPPPSCTSHTPPIPIMGETPGKDDESGSLPVRTKGVFQVVYFIHTCVCTLFCFCCHQHKRMHFFEYSQRVYELEREKNEDDNSF